MPGFVQTDLAGAGDLEVCDPAPALVLYRRYEHNPLALEFGDGVLDVMAHEEQGVMPGPAAPAGARVDRDLTRRQGEDQPAVAGIDPLEAQHVAKELPSSLGILREDDRVGAGDHGGDRSAGYWSAGAGESELSAALGRDLPHVKGGVRFTCALTPGLDDKQRSCAGRLISVATQFPFVRSDGLVDAG